MKFKFTWFIALLSLVLINIAKATANTEHIVHFEHTDHELHVYKISGEKPGKTMLIIGGMHNEPGGYVTADLFADVRLKKGNLIVVPRANMPAIVKNKRGINGDMNRTFIDKSGHDHQHIYEDDIVSILKTLISESDVLLNLHDGYGYYRPQWESELANPKRWGQAIIADRDQFYSQKQQGTLELGKRAQNVVNKVNQFVENPYHYFHYKNTKTKDSSSLHKEQRQSATFYALYEQGIESYGIETSKNIRSLDLKVTYQRMIVNAFLDEFDIEIDTQVQKLAPPKLAYILISINNQRAVAYKDGEVINVHYGDTIRIEKALTNYQRGVLVDVQNNVSLNDIDKNITMNQSTGIRVLKDKYLAGRVYVNVAAKPQANSQHVTADNQTTTKDASSTATITNMAKSPNKIIESAHLLIELNGQLKKLAHGESIDMNTSDTLRLVSYRAVTAQLEPSQINFIGFVGNTASNDGEDRGYNITEAKLIKRFSVNGDGKLYRIKAEQGKQTIAHFYVNINQSF